MAKGSGCCCCGGSDEVGRGDPIWSPCFITLFVIGLAFPLVTGIYGEVMVINNESNQQVWGGIGLLVTSFIFFFIWIALASNHVYNKLKGKNNARLAELAVANDVIPLQATMLWGFMLIGIAILPNSSNPDTALGIALLAIIVPLFTLALWCDYRMNVSSRAK